MSEYAKPLPKFDSLNQPYWEGARKGELRLLRCANCGKVSADPTRRCMACGHEALSWFTASGLGAVWSYGVFHQVYFPSFAADAPYNVAIVKLAEGPLVYTNIVGVSNGEIRIDMPVKAYFDRVTDTVTLVKFTPISEAAAG